MKRIATLLVLAAVPALAQDYSENSEAKSWNLYAEQPARFIAQVVDPLCVLAGNCPEDCGGGARQLALLRNEDDVLVLPLKNNQPAFTGAVNELYPFCGHSVEVDGLMIEDPDLGATNVYQVQKIRIAGDEEWKTANRWTKDWAKANADAKGQGPWFRRDPRILSEIEAEGYLGLGIDETAFIKDWLGE